MMNVSKWLESPSFVRITGLGILLMCLTVAPAQTLLRQFGSSQTDLANDIAITPDGNVVIVGFSQSALPRSEHLGSSDAFITSLSPQGETLYEVQFGTNRGDAASAVALDSAGNSYVVGGTEGDLASTNLGINDAFLVSFDATGTERFRTQFGTNLDDGASAVAVDASGNIFVAGFTRLELPGQESAGGSDVFVKSFDSNGNERFTVQFGSFRDDVATALAVGSDGSLFVGGSAEGAMPGNQHAGTRDGFVAKITPVGVLDFVFQFGTQRNDAIVRLVTDGVENVYGVGVTQGLFGMTSAGGDDIFVIQFDENGITKRLEQFGTDAFDTAEGMAIDANGQLYLTGFTRGTLASASAGNAGSNDVFMMVLDGNLQAIRSEQFGTLESENGRAIAVTDSGTVYIVGGTEGIFPNNTGVGGRDAFFAVF
jgi:hypothetical protein